MHALANFYRGKKIFLTGGTGFKGSWLCLLLQSFKAEVFDYSLAPPSVPSLWELANIEQDVTHRRANILDRETLKQSTNNIKPDIVIHLAAQSLVRPSYDAPYDTLENNIMGTASVLDAVLSCPSVRATLIITSDKCYENIGKPYPYNEDDRMGGYDPYSASKGCAELISNAYRKSFFNIDEKGLATVRAGNVIGGGDFAMDRLIPDMVRAFCKNEVVDIRYPQATRPWQHVLDPLNGYLLLAKELYNNPHKYSEAWNFGPLDNEAHTVENVVELFSKEWGHPHVNPIREVSPPKPTSKGAEPLCKPQNLQLLQTKVAKIPDEGALRKSFPPKSMNWINAKTSKLTSKCDYATVTTTTTTTTQAHEASFLGLDCRKAKQILNWKPKLNFQESVQWTAEWYKAWHDGSGHLNAQNINALCCNQIQRFMEKE